MSKEMNANKEKVSIAAVVVTYNRKELLRQNLNSLLAQTRPLDEIIVVNNASTDGTAEMLAREFEHPQITVLTMPENIGSSGGFHEGMKLAYKKGHDWIWVMDDDAYPSSDALQSLTTRIQHGLRNEADKCILYSIYVDKKLTRFSEPVSLIRDENIKSILWFDKELSGLLLEGTGGPFLGLLISRHAIKQVGLPRDDTFIWGDYEYLGRLRKAGFRVYYDFQSLLFHPLHSFKAIWLPIGLLKLQRPIWRPFYRPMGPAWKQYYGIRNSLYFSIRNNSKLNKPIQILKAIALSIIWLLIAVIYSADKRYKVAYACWLGIMDGIRGRMGVRLKP